MRPVTRAFYFTGALAGLAIARGVAEPYLLEVRREVARVPGLPPSWAGKKIGLLADLHVGMLGGPLDTIRVAVDRLIRERPALVLIAGDFIHDSRRYVSEATELVSPLIDEGIPTYAVLGNHDYAMPTSKDEADLELAHCLEMSLERAGIRVLTNEVIELRGDGGEEPLYLVGIGSHTARRDDVRATISRVPSGAPRIVLMHHPASFDGLAGGEAPFAVAGHTHGGQVRLPFAPLTRYFTYLKELEVIVSGWIDDQAISGYGREGNHLYVTRGIGCSVLPLRLFCRPEVTLFTLRPG